MAITMATYSLLISSIASWSRRTLSSRLNGSLLLNTKPMPSYLLAAAMASSNDDQWAGSITLAFVHSELDKGFWKSFHRRDGSRDRDEQRHNEIDRGCKFIF